MGVRLVEGPWSDAADTQACYSRPNSPDGSGRLGPPFVSVRLPRVGFAEHLSNPRARGTLADAQHSGAAGGASCGDVVRIGLRVEGERVAEAGFDPSGCGAALAAGSAAVELVSGKPLLPAARLDTEDIASELGGLSPRQRHPGELASGAPHLALGAAGPDGGPRP